MLRWPKKPSVTASASAPSQTTPANRRERCAQSAQVINAHSPQKYVAPSAGCTLAASKVPPRYGYAMFTSRDAGVGLPAFLACFQRRRKMSEIVASGIVSRVLNVCIARKGKKIIGSHRKRGEAVLDR